MGRVARVVASSCQALKPIKGQVWSLVQETENGSAPTANQATWCAQGASMPLQQLCVLCAEPLPIPRRADARYCRRSTCRVRAFRVRHQDGASREDSPRKSWRLPTADADSPAASPGTQLAAFRVLRQAQRRAADLAAQLAQAVQASAHQRLEHEKETQALRNALDEARQQAALRDHARLAFQALAESAAEATRDHEAERKRAAEREERLTRTLATASTERAESERRLRQEHILQLCEARAAAHPLIEAAAQAGMDAGLAAAQSQLVRLTLERDQARAAEAQRRQTLATQGQELSTLKAELVNARAFIREALTALKQSPSGRSLPQDPDRAVHPSAAAPTPVGLAIQAAFAGAKEMLAPVPGTPSSSPPAEPAQTPTPSALGRRRYPRLEQALKRS